MKIIFTFLAKNGDEVSGKITGLPDFDPLESKTNHARLMKLLEGWTGREVFELFDLETSDDISSFDQLVLDVEGRN